MDKMYDPMDAEHAPEYSDNLFEQDTEIEFRTLKLLQKK